MGSKFVNKLKYCYLPPFLTANFTLFYDLFVAFFFRFKDRFSLRFRSCVVYKFTCQCCQASYVGKTCRLLQTRVYKYMHVLFGLHWKRAITPHFQAFWFIKKKWMIFPSYHQVLHKLMFYFDYVLLLINSNIRSFL